MKQFWEKSWDNVDQNRVTEYVRGEELSSDPIIEFLKKQRVRTVCDAGCGCGVYSLKLAANGFRVFSFDVSSTAAEMTGKLLASKDFACENVKAADILATGYHDGQFDAVISRDVVDHMTQEEGIAAVKELHRITRDGGFVILTLDKSDSEYESQPHTVNGDGDYLFTKGKWKGMVFHPYSEDQISRLVQVGTVQWIESGTDGFLVIIKKAMQ